MFSLTAKAPLNAHRKHYLLVATFLMLLTISIAALIIYTYATKTEKPLIDTTIKTKDPFLEPKTSLENAIHVKTETELRAALTNAPNNTYTTITLYNDIKLTQGSIVIGANMDVTLTSSRDSGFYKLIHATEPTSGTYTMVRDPVISVSGVLRLDGIIVTHNKGISGEGVYVSNGGTLIMYDGEISGNNSTRWYVDHRYMGGCGGGVYNYMGTFVMFGGKITNNAAHNGGGVYTSSGNFTMYGGTISNNHSDVSDGGVCGTVERLGGKIYGNTCNNFYVIICLGVLVIICVVIFLFLHFKSHRRLHRRCDADAGRVVKTIIS